MKKLLKILFTIFVTLFVGILILMFSLGNEYHFEKTVYVNSPVEKVWPHVNSMTSMNAWSPFLKLDPNMKQQYSGTSGEVGDTYYWSGNDEAGEGEERIAKLEHLHRTDVDLHFIRPFESKATSSIILEPKGNGTQVTWTLDTHMDYPSNLMKLFMDGQMDEFYGDGLQSLKQLAEKVE